MYELRPGEVLTLEELKSSRAFFIDLISRSIARAKEAGCLDFPGFAKVGMGYFVGPEVTEYTVMGDSQQILVGQPLDGEAWMIEQARAVSMKRPSRIRYGHRTFYGALSGEMQDGPIRKSPIRYLADTEQEIFDPDYGRIVLRGQLQALDISELQQATPVPELPTARWIREWQPF